MEAERLVRLFRNGRNQAIRIPKEFELEGEEAILRKEDDHLVIEPVRKKDLLAVISCPRIRWKSSTTRTSPVFPLNGVKPPTVPAGYTAPAPKSTGHSLQRVHPSRQSDLRSQHVERGAFLAVLQKNAHGLGCFLVGMPRRIKQRTAHETHTSAVTARKAVNVHPGFAQQLPRLLVARLQKLGFKGIIRTAVLAHRPDRPLRLREIILSPDAQSYERSHRKMPR